MESCIGMCEIGKSDYRGHEVIYPQPFGITTTASQKAYPVDLSHFNIMGTAVGAIGIEEGSTIENGKVVCSTDLENRVKLYKEWQREGYGAIIMQANVEDSRLGVLEYE